MSSGKLVLLILSGLVVAVFIVTVGASIITRPSAQSPGVAPAPDHGKQLADNYKSNQTAAAEIAATECWVKTGTEKGAANVMERSFVQQRVESGKLTVIVPLLNASNGSRGECNFEWDSGAWLDHWEIIARRQRNAASAYVATAPTAPTIGMSSSTARDSTWGSPDHVNTTTTASGTHEQWVYGRNRYLYFDNGVLTSIQESR